MKFPFSILKNILKKTDIVMEPGTDVPYPPRISRTKIDDVTGEDAVEKSAKSIAKSLAIEHPRIGPDLVSLVISHGTYGDYVHNVSFMNPVLKPGKINVFWRYPDVHDRKLEENIRRFGKDDEKLKEKNIEFYREFVTRCLRATYLPEDLEQKAQKTGIPPAKLREALEGIPEVDWEKEARNAVLIKVSQRIPEAKDPQTAEKNIKPEPSFQVIEDQVECFDLFHPAKTLSELISEYKIQTKEDISAEEKIALVLKELTNKYNDKVTIILLRDETDKGWGAEKTARHLGVDKIYPIFDYEAFQKVNGLTTETRYSKAIKPGIGAVALILALGFGYMAGKYSGPGQPAKKSAVEEVTAPVKTTVAKAPSKPAKKAPAKHTKKSVKKTFVKKKSTKKKAAASSKPYAIIKPVYDSKKKEVRIVIYASDPDGIEKIIANSKSGIGMDENIFNITYGVRPCALCKKRKIMKNQTEKYESETGSGYWLRGDTYNIRFEITDTKGNTAVYNRTLKIPHK